MTHPFTRANINLKFNLIKLNFGEWFLKGSLFFLPIIRALDWTELRSTQEDPNNLLKGRDILNGRLQPVAGHSESKEARNKGRTGEKDFNRVYQSWNKQYGLSRMHSAVDRLSIKQKKNSCFRKKRSPFETMAREQGTLKSRGKCDACEKNGIKRKTAIEK